MSQRIVTRHTPPWVLALAIASAILVAACSGTTTLVAPTRAPATLAPSALATAAPAASGVTLAPAAALPATVSVAEAAALRDAGAYILDVRQPEEWAEVHIPGAVLIPLGELPGRLAEVPRDSDVVVVCRSGNRSQAGRDILRDAGYARVTSMAGGVTEWQAAGLPTESGA